MKTRAQYQGLATGGLRSADYARCGIRTECSDAAQYCLDAPSYLPAGSVENYSSTNWRGRPIIAQSETPRERATP